MTLRIGAGFVDPVRREVAGPHAIVALSELELAMLTRLGVLPNAVVSREDLLVDVFGYAPSSRSRTIYTTISRLRNRLKEAGLDDSVLQSVYGQGYRLQVPQGSLTHSIGRDEEMKALEAWWSRPEASAMLLVGPGGMGKTVLAETLAAVTTRNAFVGLQSARGRADVLFLVRRAIGIEDGNPSESIIPAISGPPFLLVLDNVEHLTAAVAQLTEDWLAQATTLKVLITSRTEIALPGLNRLVVGPMSTEASEQLFRDSAAELAPGAPLDGDMNKLLAGLEHHPLSIRLAASRLRVLSVDQLVSRLDRRLELLRGRSEVPRHQDLGVMLQTSLDALPGPAAEGIVAAAVLPDGFSLPRFSALLPDQNAEDLLQYLVEAHLVQRNGHLFDLHAFVRESVLAQAPPTLQTRVRLSLLDQIEAEILEAEHTLGEQPVLEDLFHALSCAMDMERHEHAAVILSGLGQRARAEIGTPRFLADWIFDPPETLSSTGRARLLTLQSTIVLPNDLRAATEFADQAIAQSENAPLGVRYLARALRGIGLALNGEREEALAEVERLGALIEEVREPRWRFHFAVSGMVVDQCTRSYDSVLRRRDRHGPLEPLGALPDRLLFRSIETNTLGELGRYAEATACAKKAWTVVEQGGVSSVRRARVLMDVGHCEALNRRYSEACQVFEDLEAERHPGHLWNRIRAASHRLLYRSWGLAWDQAREARTLLIELECRAPDMARHRALGMLRWYEGFVGNLSADALEDPLGGSASTDYFAHGMHLAQLGHLKRALTFQRETTAELDIPDTHRLKRESRATLAELLMASGEFEEADHVWTKVFDGLTQLPLEGAIWRAAQNAAQGAPPSPLPPGSPLFGSLAAACWDAVGLARRGQNDHARRALIPVEAALRKGGLPGSSELGWRLRVAQDSAG